MDNYGPHRAAISKALTTPSQDAFVFPIPIFTMKLSNLSPALKPDLEHLGRGFFNQTLNPKRIFSLGETHLPFMINAIIEQGKLNYEFTLPNK